MAESNEYSQGYRARQNPGYCTEDLHSRTSFALSTPPEPYTKSICDLQAVIQDGKREFWTKLELQGNGTDTCEVWQGSQGLTAMKWQVGSTIGTNGSLPEEHNAFYTRFEQKIGGAPSPTQPFPGLPAPTVTVAYIQPHGK